MCFLFLDSPEEFFHLLAIYCLPHQDNSPLAKIQNNNSSLAVSLTIYPLIPASIQPSISFIYPSFHIIYSSIHLSIRLLSVCLSVRSSVHLSVCLFFYSIIIIIYYYLCSDFFSIICKLSINNPPIHCSDIL